MLPIVKSEEIKIEPRKRDIKSNTKSSESSTIQFTNPEAQEILNNSKTYPLPDVSGRGANKWTKQDKILFIDLVRKYGKDWYRLQQIMEFRTKEQLMMQSHNFRKHYQVHQIDCTCHQEICQYMAVKDVYSILNENFNLDPNKHSSLNFIKKKENSIKSCDTISIADSQQLKITPWSQEEHNRFIEGVRKYGKKMINITNHVKKSYSQVYHHAKLFKNKYKIHLDFCSCSGVCDQIQFQDVYDVLTK